MRRHKVLITCEVETVQTLAELKKLERLFFSYEPGTGTGTYLDRDPEAEKNCGPCRGTITQVKAQVVQPVKAAQAKRAKGAK